MRIPRTALTALFNRLHDRGDTPFAVAHPSDAVGDLVRIDLDDWDDTPVSFVHDADSYATARTAVAREHGEDVAADLPESRSFVMAAVAAGILPLANADELEVFLDRHGDPDLMAGHQPVFAGFDTNLLAWRPDEVLGLRDPDAGLGYVNGFVLATGVRDELDWDHKCDDTRRFIDAFGAPFDAYWNQPLGARREGRLGHERYRTIRDIEQAREIDSEPMDEAIVAAYETFQRDQRGQVVLFSNDRTFVTRATDHTLAAQHVAFPRDVPRRADATWRQLETFVYTLAVLFGIVELPAVTIRGVWSGKSGLDWQHERLDLDCRSPKIEPELATDLEVIERYRSLRSD
ncbi:MAG: hypothetical protein ACLFMX_04280 [Halobacteriales archaeon]